MLGEGGGLLECLPKEVGPRAILPLGSLHADPVLWHLGSLYAAVGGAHQSDRNSTLDVSTRLRVGLITLGGQATVFPFQGSHRLHPQKPVHQGGKGGEVLTLLGASLQIHLLLPPFRLVEALFQVLFLVCGSSVFTTRM